MANRFAQALADLEAQGLRRQTSLIEGPQGPRVRLAGREVILLCSNNYLGLADHPAVKEAAAQAALRYGTAAAASRLVSGTMELHRMLEERLAAFKGYQAALLFGSGYLANLGLLCALTGPGDLICSDQLNHASIVDGCRLSRATVAVYRHRDLDHLAWLLEQGRWERRLIVTDTVFSMDGDRAPLADLLALARRHHALLVADEAHASGTVGPGGRGAVAEAGLEGEVDLVVGTLGKALASYGAYVCASRTLISYLENVARPFIFSTALPPPALGAALAALEVVEAEPGRVAALQWKARLLRRALADQGFAVEPAGLHIIPLVVGEPGDALAFSRRLRAAGVFVQAIRPPSVPPGSARLRLTVMATHREDDLGRAATLLGRAAREVGLAPSAVGQRAAVGVGG